MPRCSSDPLSDKGVTPRAEGETLLFDGTETVMHYHFKKRR